MVYKGHDKKDKINALAALEINDHNVTQTAKDFGVTRKTIYSWMTQMENDVRLLKLVEAARNNIANLEELKAIKAQGELSRRLDNQPETLKPQDLQKIIDSGINNSRLIRGEATSITKDINNGEETLKALLLQGLSQGFDADKIRQAALYLQVPGISEEGRVRVLAEVLSKKIDS
jgi:transposase-like protein